MRRRDFLAMVGATAPLAAWRRAYGQPTPRRAAVVIGINKSGDLPVLNAAVSGARTFAGWLRTEGFEVREFLDDQGPITGNAIFKGIDDLLKPGTLQQLIVYFSGHGFQLGFGEYWLLSDAPRNPNEAINHRESVELARRTDVPNIVFISDACRSTADSVGMHALQGQYIFPATAGTGSGRVTVDQFFAALPGSYALELPVADSVTKHEGIYTAAFLDAYRRPDNAMVKQVSGVPVVPNRLLKDYLLREVNKRAEARSIRLTQRPESRVESDESIYIGRVSAPPVGASPPPPPSPATISDVAHAALGNVGFRGVGPTPNVSSADVTGLANASGFDTVRAARIDAASPQVNVPRQFETKTGFVVFGAKVARVSASKPQMSAELLEPGDGAARPAIIRVHPVPGTLVVRFSDGSGTAVAAMPEYIGTMIVKSAGVVDVSYLPSQNSGRHPGDGDMQRLNQLRASVATAAQYGVFRLDGSRDTRNRGAEELADRIRMMKSIDPTLGLYATYAYSDAGLPQKIASVRSIMRDDLQFDLFDAAMLAGALSDKTWTPDGRVEPFCPMLTQGWNLLRVKGANLPAAVQNAGAHLRASLWTTFAAPGVDLIEGFVKRGL